MIDLNGKNSLTFCDKSKECKLWVEKIIDYSNENFMELRGIKQVAFGKWHKLFL
jgi:hypothetical protein